MRTVHDIVLWFHIACGCIGLVVFWVPALTPKGGPTHRKAGWVYVSAMLGVVASAVVLAALLFLDPSAAHDFGGGQPEAVAAGVVRAREVAVLFGALALLTFTNGWHGLRILRAKRNPLQMRTAFNIGLHASNVLVALPLLVLGIRDGLPLLVVFGILCFVTGVTDLRSLWRPSPDPRHWLYAHLSSMIGSGVAAHTAFLALGAVWFVPPLYAFSPALYLIPWTAPAATGFIAITILQRHYRRKLEAAEQSADGAAQRSEPTPVPAAR
jgi:hypothetical protein